MKLVSLESPRRNTDVRVSVQGECCPALTSESIEAGSAAAVCPMIVFPNEPWSTGPAVETDHVLTTGEGNRTVLPAETGLAVTGVIGDVI